MVEIDEKTVKIVEMMDYIDEYDQYWWNDDENWWNDDGDVDVCSWKILMENTTSSYVRVEACRNQSIKVSKLATH